MLCNMYAYKYELLCSSIEMIWLYLLNDKFGNNFFIQFVNKNEAI